MKAWLLLGILCCAGCAPNSSSERNEAPPSQTADPNVVHPLVDAAHAQLLGAAVDGRWLPADSAERRVEGGETYRLYTLTRFLGEARGTTPEAPDETCTNGAVRIEPLSESEDDIIAVGGAWDALPRAPVAQSTTLPAYQEAVSALLREQGIDDPIVNISQILRVDLEGDGTDEVLVSAYLRRGMGTSAQAGDYGFVVLRKVVDDEVRTIPLAEEYYPEECMGDCAPMIFRVSAVLDLNGDGVQEVILSLRDYEGEGKAVYVVDGDRVQEVLYWGCFP